MVEEMEEPVVGSTEAGVVREERTEGSTGEGDRGVVSAVDSESTAASERVAWTEECEVVGKAG